MSHFERKEQRNNEKEVPKGCWMSAGFLKSQYGVTDLSPFQIRKAHNGCVGDDGLRYMLPYGTPFDPVTVDDEITLLAKGNVTFQQTSADDVTLQDATLCPDCGATLSGRRKPCSVRCRKRLSRRRQ